jgi:hypothetical protein
MGESEFIYLDDEETEVTQKLPCFPTQTFLYELCAYKHDSEAEKKNTKSGEQK